MKREHGAHEPRFRPDVMPLLYRDFLFQLLDSIPWMCRTTRRRRHVPHDCFNCSAHRFCPPLVEVFVLTRSASHLAFGKDDVSCLDMPTRHTRTSRGTEAPALLRGGGRDGKRLARSTEAACLAARAKPANPRSRRRNWIFLTRTHGQVSSVDRRGPGRSSTMLARYCKTRTKPSRKRARLLAQSLPNSTSATHRRQPPKFCRKPYGHFSGQCQTSTSNCTIGATTPFSMGYAMAGFNSD